MSELAMFIVDNWVIILAAAVLIMGFILLPTDAKKARIREWLLWAVALAEKKLGSGTGALKLRYVYANFMARFPFLSKFITFETFSSWVDEALKELEGLIESNDNVKSFIED